MLALGSTQELNILDETGSIFIGGTLNDNDMHALIRSCTNLATLSCTTMTRPMIAAYPFPSPKPRHLRLRTRCYFGSWRSDWASCLDIVEMMHTPLTASVNTLTIDFMMEETGLPEFYSTESSEAQFRKVFTSLGWERLDCLPPNISTLYLSFNLRLARPVGDGHRRRMMAEDLVLGLISPQVREIIQTPLQIQVYSSSESGSAGAAAVKEVSS
ncbi:hypothetical protein PsYK624_107790 [Phanerochaete sordida]|uniref:Uncharacterized protein n=1 Tax=Phanerochaete sordida TaxID=48140 RepID=A0A9P3GJB4_9APHY|nr:hypothetical protein PsYK624_107790 [Phanerochaete sordida]